MSCTSCPDMAVSWSLVLVMLAVPAVASAQDRADRDADETVTAAITPYMWVTGFNGTIDVVDRVSVDAAPTGAFASSQFGSCAAFELRAGRAAVLIDMTFATLTDAATASAAPKLTVAVRSLTLGSLIGYRVVNAGRASLDLLVGVRIVRFGPSLGTHRHRSRRTSPTRGPSRLAARGSNFEAATDGPSWFTSTPAVKAPISSAAVCRGMPRRWRAGVSPTTCRWSAATSICTSGGTGSRCSSTGRNTGCRWACWSTASFGSRRPVMRPSGRRAGALAGAAITALLLTGPAGAQDMEPKAYSASPIDLNYIVASATWSSGSVVFDPTLPISDVQADVDGMVLAIGHSFDLFGDLAMVTAALPYVRADVSGRVQEQAAATSRSGLGDARLRLSVNLRGNPAMTAREFAAAPRRTIVGVSLTVGAPAGQYYPGKVDQCRQQPVGVQTRSWRVDPVSPARRRRLPRRVAVHAEQRLLSGRRRSHQEPVVALQLHVSYTLRPRLWVAGDSTWYSGGRTRVGDGELSTSVNNARAGVTLSVPVGPNPRSRWRTNGVIVRSGTNFSTVAIAWQLLWPSRRK